MVPLSKAWTFGEIPSHKLGEDVVEYKSGEKYPKALLDALNEVQKECHAFLSEHVDPHPSAELVHLWLLGETLMNAIGHGNKLDPGKIVEVMIHVRKEMAEQSLRIFAELSVHDEGEHFDPAAVPDASENLEKPTGRGLQTSIGLLERRYGEGNGEVTVDPIPPTDKPKGKRVRLTWSVPIPEPPAETEGVIFEI